MAWGAEGNSYPVRLPLPPKCHQPRTTCGVPLAFQDLQNPQGASYMVQHSQNWNHCCHLPVLMSLGMLTCSARAYSRVASLLKLPSGLVLDQNLKIQARTNIEEDRQLEPHYPHAP